MELIAFIVLALVIVAAIGKSAGDYHSGSGSSSNGSGSGSTKDYYSVQYHKDWDKSYNRWKLRGVDDNTARANSFKEVQENKKDGKYDK